MLFGKSIREQRMDDRIKEAKGIREKIQSIKAEIRIIEDEEEVFDILKELNEDKEVLVKARDEAKKALSLRKKKDVSWLPPWIPE